MTQQHPGASPYKDRHRRVRWRYRRSGKTWVLPHQPGHPAFEAAYTAAITGQPITAAKVHPLPGAAHLRSLRAAWRIVTRSAEWQRLKPSSQAQQIGVAERFLSTPVAEGETLRYGDLPLPDLRRRHIKDIFARWSPTPRTVYALALYQGHRRGDVARIKWSDLEADAASIMQQKGGKAVWIPLPAELMALEAAPRRGATIIVTHYGKPFSNKALGNRMRDWCNAAGVPPGYTLHGLRKTLGKLLAEGGATTRQIMGILGHSSIAHAELYTREAEQKLLASRGMKSLEFAVRSNK